MAAQTTIVIKHDSKTPAQAVADKLIHPAAHKGVFAARLVNFLTGIFSGARNGRVSIKVDDVSTGDRASATATCATVIATDALLIGPVTLTVVASSANENQVTVGGSDTAMATNFAAAINAHSVLSGVVTATSSAAVVTITSAYPGGVGEFIAVSSPDATITVSSAYLAGITSTSQAIFRDHTFGVA